MLAVIACAGTFAFSAGGEIAAAATQSRRALVVRHDAVARAATAVATTEFLLHAGIAYYAFDHYIWQPYKAGDLTHGFTHKIKIAEAGVAALVVYHELKLAITNVRSSRLLSFLAVPLTAAVAKLGSLKSQISAGNLNSLNGVQSSLGAIKQQSASKGVVIKEIEKSIL